MFRANHTPLLMYRVARPNKLGIPRYHRKAMSLYPGSRWHGNYGAYGAFKNKIALRDDVGPTRTLVTAEREQLRYLHDTRIRHSQLARVFSEKLPSQRRAREWNKFFSRIRFRKLTTCFNAYMQFETLKTLKTQADFVTKYGQASVNRALGDYISTREREENVGLVKRMVHSPKVSKAAPKHVLTREQIHNDRFDRRPKVWSN